MKTDQIRVFSVVVYRKAVAKSNLQSVQPNVSTSGQTDSLQPSSTVDWTVSAFIIIIISPTEPRQTDFKPTKRSKTNINTKF